MILSDPGRRGAWIQTFSGRKFWPLDPRPNEIAIEDVAHALSNVCRYGAHTRRFYSVAEHAVIVSLHVPPHCAREGLLHDTAEAYVGDMVRPLKHQPEMAEYRRAEEHIELAVRERFGLSTDRAVWAAVKEIDDRIVLDEVAALMHTPSFYLDRYAGIRPIGTTIAGLPPAQAEHVFVTRFLELFPEIIV
jgi:hypothetical protein